MIFTVLGIATLILLVILAALVLYGCEIEVSYTPGKDTEDVNQNDDSQQQAMEDETKTPEL